MPVYQILPQNIEKRSQQIVLAAEGLDSRSMWSKRMERVFRNII